MEAFYHKKPLHSLKNCFSLYIRNFKVPAHELEKKNSLVVEYVPNIPRYFSYVALQQVRTHMETAEEWKSSSKVNSVSA